MVPSTADTGIVKPPSHNGDPVPRRPPLRDGAGSGSFAVYRIALRLPENTPGYVLTHGRPDLRLEVLNRMDLADGTLMIEGRLIGPRGVELVPLAKKTPGVISVEVRSESEHTTLYRAIIQPPQVWSVLRRHRILTRYPITVIDGWARFETLAPADQIRRLVKDLTKEVGPSRVEAVRQGSVRSSTLGLTTSQLAVFREALATGYFGSPRRISLTELARRLGRTKSTVSQQLALIQRRLAESALRLKWEPLALTG